MPKSEDARFPHVKCRPTVSPPYPWVLYPPVSHLRTANHRLKLVESVIAEPMHRKGRLRQLIFPPTFSERLSLHTPPASATLGTVFQTDR